MKRCLFLGAAVLAISLVGCPDTTTTPTTSHVFIAGKVGTASNNTVPVYWEDEILNFFPLSPGFTNGWASCIAVDSSGTVYAQGGQWGSTTKYGYWKGSTFTELSLGAYTECWDNGLAVDSMGNVWIAAILGNSSPPTIPVYWKNSGSPSSLTDCTNKWGLGADTLGNVYFAGTIGGTSDLAPVVDWDWTPAYWKNGAGGLTGPTTLQLSGGNTNGYAGQVGVDAAGNSYICGVQWSATTPGRPVYWKNDESPIQLSVGVYGAYEYWSLGITAIDASGKLHVVGRIGPTNSPDTVIYWSGATSDPAPLSLDGNAYWNVWNAAGAVDAKVNFFVVGSVGSSSSATIPVYWKNGEDYVELPMGPGNSYGEANTVVVGP